MGRFIDLLIVERYIRRCHGSQNLNKAAMLGRADGKTTPTLKKFNMATGALVKQRPPCAGKNYIYQ